MAAERQTILTSPNRRTAPLASMQTDPSGAFGDATGLTRLGQGISAVGGAVQDVRQHALQKRNQRDRRDFQDQVELARSEYAKRQTVTLAKARESNLRGEDLFGFVEKERQAAFQEFSGRLSAFRPRNPELYDELVGQDTMLTWVRPVDESVFQKAFRLDERLAREDRENTFATLADNRFQSGYNPSTNRVNPDAIMAAALTSLEDLNEPGRFGQDFIRQKKAELGNRAFDGLMASASAGDPESLKFAVEAAEKGLIGQVERRRIESTYADAIKRDVPKEAMRAPFEELVNLLRNGRPIDLSGQRDIVLNAARSYETEQAARKGVIEPLVQVELQRRTDTQMTSSFNWENMRDLQVALQDPNSPRTREEFDRDWKTSLSHVSRALGMDIQYVPGDREFQDWLNRKQTFVNNFHKLVESGRAHEAVANHELMRMAAAQKLDTPGQIEVLRSVYEQMGIPADKRVLITPQQEDTWIRQLQTAYRDPSKIEPLLQEFMYLHQALGQNARSTFFSLASRAGPVAVVPAYLAQLDSAVDESSRRNIVGNLSTVIQAQAWKLSEEGKKALAADTPLARSVQTALHATLAVTGSDDLESKLAEVTGEEPGKMVFRGSHLSQSALYQALQNEGVAEPVIEAFESLAQYLTFAHPQRMSPAKAAEETLKVASAAFIPMRANAAEAAQPVWRLGPTFSAEDDWFNPGRRPFSASSLSGGIYDNAAAIDAMIVGGVSPSAFHLAGQIQWSGSTLLAGLFSGLRMGHVTGFGDQAPGVSTAFLHPMLLAQDGDDLDLIPGGDYTKLGVVGEDGKFVGLTDYATKPPSYWPRWVQEAFARYTKRVNMKDPKAADTLARIIFAENREMMFDAASKSYQFRLMPGSRYQGLAGTVRPGTGPWATLVQQQPDGSLKPLSLDVNEVHRKIESIRNIQPFFSTGMPAETRKAREKLLEKQRALGTKGGGYPE